MIAGITSPKAFRLLLGIFSLLGGVLVISGCEADSYPESLSYPLRSDPLVMKVPTDESAQPTQFDLPGTLTSLIEQINEKKGQTFSPADLDSKKRDSFEKTLETLFGTPAHPKVGGIDDATRDALKLDEATLTKGSGLYRRHCLHCHGVSGDGRGPTAAWVNPHPRDYRRGIFKFTSTAGSSDRKPRRDDLLRTLRQGIEGTSMPTFGLLSNDELEALASYVIHLSLRGQTEYGTMLVFLDKSQSPEFAEPSSPDPVAEEMKGRLALYAKDHWVQTAQPIPVVEYAVKDQAASVAAGHKIFKTIGCLGCHLNYGRKDNLKFDEWGTIVRPANLTTGVYRGGRRPIDIYWRIHAGINGAQMPSAKDALEAIKKDAIWDLVNFVQALPYPAMLPESKEHGYIRTEIYGGETK